MTDREQADSKSTEELPHGELSENEDLPYSVALWPEDESSPVKILARATSIVLARAIYIAALTENPGRHITLRRGSDTISDSRKL